MKKLALLVFLLIPTIAESQTVINPTRAQFNPSADHNTVENGVTIVTGYELQIFPASGTTPIRTVNLDKPVPDAGNVIVIDIQQLVVSLPVGTYTAKVLAKGPGGETASESSNSFQVAVRPPTAPTNLVITK